jgi:hypothetical protein
VWRYATVNAPWVKDIDSDGCSLSTPVACGLLKMAREEGWGGEALRGEESSADSQDSESTPGRTPKLAHLSSVVGLVWRSVVLWLVLLALLTFARFLG